MSITDGIYRVIDKCDSALHRLDARLDRTFAIGPVKNCFDIFTKTIILPRLNPRTISNSNYLYFLNKKSINDCISYIKGTPTEREIQQLLKADCIARNAIARSIQDNPLSIGYFKRDYPDYSKNAMIAVKADFKGIQNVDPKCENYPEIKKAADIKATPLVRRAGTPLTDSLDPRLYKVIEEKNKLEVNMGRPMKHPTPSPR